MPSISAGLVAAQTAGTVAQALGAPPVLNTSLIGAEVARLSVDGQNALEQAERAVIKDDATLGKATDLLKAITAAISKQDAARKAHTKPLDEFKSKISTMFGAGLEKLEKAKSILKDKAGTYAVAEQRRRDAEAAIAAEALRKEAEKLAAAQAALGDDAGADQILEEAAEVKVAAPKVAGAGKFGGTGGLRKTTSGAVTNNRDFLEQIVMGESPAFDKFIADLRFPQSALNELAEAVVAGSVPPIPGFEAKQSESFVAR